MCSDSPIRSSSKEERLRLVIGKASHPMDSRYLRSIISTTPQMNNQIVSACRTPWIQPTSAMHLMKPQQRPTIDPAATSSPEECWFELSDWLAETTSPTSSHALPDNNEQFRFEDLLSLARETWNQLETQNTRGLMFRRHGWNRSPAVGHDCGFRSAFALMCKCSLWVLRPQSAIVSRKMCHWRHRICSYNEDYTIYKTSILFVSLFPIILAPQPLPMCKSINMYS